MNRQTKQNVAFVMIQLCGALILIAFFLNASQPHTFNRSLDYTSFLKGRKVEAQNRHPQPLYMQQNI